MSRAKSGLDPFFQSHSLTVPSLLPEANNFPSGLKAILMTNRVCPLNRLSSCPLVTSHRLNVESVKGADIRYEADARSRPSGPKARLDTESPSMFNCFTSLKVLLSHNLMVLSKLPDAKNRPLGSKATPQILSVCRSRRCTLGIGG